MPMHPDGFWVPELSPKQMEIFNCNSRYLLVSGPRYSGKCVDARTIVWGQAGLRRISSFAQNLSPGEQVPISYVVASLNTDASKPTPAVATSAYRDPSTKGFEISVDGGFALKCSAWHPIWSCVNGRFKYRTASEIKSLVRLDKKVDVPIWSSDLEWDCPPKTVCFFHYGKESDKAREIVKRLIPFRGMAVSKAAKASKTNYDTVKKYADEQNHPKQWSVEITIDVAYLLGVLVGDGALGNAKKHHSAWLSSGDSEITDRVDNILAEHFNGSLRKGSTYDWCIRSVKLRAMLVHLEMDKYAHEKSIPDCIVESPKPVIRSFLQGLFDTDGCALKTGRVEYCSSSKELSEDVQSLLLCFGVASTRKFRPNNKRGAWHIYIDCDASLFAKRVGFCLTRKRVKNETAKAKKTTRKQSYPESIIPALKRLSLTRFERGAQKNLLSRHLKRGNRLRSLDNYTRGDYRINQDRLRVFIDFTKASGDVEINRYFLNGDFLWRSIKSVTSCAVDLYDITVKTHHNFIANGFVNHNTIACSHRLVRHLWESNGARVAIFAKTLKSAKQGGTYQELLESILPEWLDVGLKSEHGARFRWHTEPKIDGASRTPMFAIENYYGGKSEAYLFSLDHDDDVESKVKNTYFSMFYFIELSNFFSRDVFTITTTQLRMKKLPFEGHQWMGDTNPAEDGEKSWIYKLWYQKEKPLEAEAAMIKHLKVIEVYIADNPYLSIDQIEDLKAKYAHDPELYERYINGKWTVATRSGHFSDVFLPNIHIRGDASHYDKAKWQIIVPTVNCFELLTGWDLGETNHSAHIAQTRTVNQNSAYDFIDELCCIDQQTGIADFTEAFMEKMDFWEEYIRQTYKRNTIRWRHWSDDTATNYKATIDTTQKLQVARLSGNRIWLQGIAKPKGSIRQRVNITRQLLFESRLFVSAQLVYSIKMFRSLKKGTGTVNFVDRWDPTKHVFDSMTYIIAGEEPNAIIGRIPKVDRAARPVSIALA